jgi:hypothetical protein
MKIYINYENKKKYINTCNYQSIKSIIYQYLCENNINKNIENFFLDYNGLYLDTNFSLEKYNILDNFVLNLNIKKKGGKKNKSKDKNSFLSYLSKNPMKVGICLLLALLPVILLPLSFISTTSCLLELILKKSIDSIGKYLVCVLGKITLFRRIKLLIFIFKYSVFTLMVYVIITLPLLLLFTTIKGHSIIDNPKDLCSPIGISNTIGLILTVLYFFIYSTYRCGNYIIDFFISLCKKFYILNTTFNPILISLKNTYNEIKYLPIIFLTFGSIKGFFIFLELLLSGI